MQGLRKLFHRSSRQPADEGAGNRDVETAANSTTNLDAVQPNTIDNESMSSVPTDASALGLKVLVEGKNPIVDIVAVHGLNGHCDKTWTAKNKVNWLRDPGMLPAKIPNARICSWGYDANTHSTKELTAMYLYDHAQKLVSDLSLKRRLTKTERRPIIFVAHSLGGIVIKSALIHSNSTHSHHLPEHRAIKTSTCGIIFMGTPHQGGEGVAWGQRLVNVASIFVNTNDNLLKILARDSETLQSQLSQYQSISSDFITKFAYESYPTPLAFGKAIIIVPKSSAVVLGAVDAEAIAINDNHINMIKFPSETDEGFETVAGHLMLMVEKACAKVSRNWEMEGIVENARIGTLKPDFRVPFDLKSVPKTNAFIGRDSDLDLMRQHLAPATESNRRRICVLHGLGGIGKTQLAIEYAILHKDTYTSFFWLDGKTEESLVQSLLSIASRLPKGQISNINIQEIKGIEDSKERAQEVLQWFALEGNSKWLLVFDNIDRTSYEASPSDADSLSSYDITQYFPGGDFGAIVITTRLQRLATLGDQVHLHKIDVRNGVLILEKHAGKSFKRSSGLAGRGETETEIFDPDAVALVERLEGLPLALVLAGSYISRTTVAKYLELYSKSWNDLHERMDIRHDYPGRTIVTTWKISYDELKRKDEGAAKLLQLWGYLDNQDLWFQLLQWPYYQTRAPGWLRQITITEITFLDTIQTLLGYSLIEQREGSESYSMHAVVHDWIREFVNRDQDGQLLRTAMATIGLVVPHAYEKDYWIMQRRLLPHAIRLSQNSHKWLVFSLHPNEVDDIALLDGLHNLGNLYKAQGKLAEAEAMYQRTLAVQSQ